MSEEKKPGFLDKLKKTVDQAWAASDPAVRPRVQPPAGASKTGPIAPPPAQKRTDHLQRSAATAQLGASRTAPLPEEAQKALSASDHELSPKRLAMIDDFMTGKAKLDQMKDPTFMYKIVSDERAYQTQLLFTLQEDLLLAGGGEAAAALEARIQRSQAIVTNLFKVLKYITGKKGRTGGTGFLSEEK